MNLDQIKANKALVRRVIEEVWNKGDLLVIPQVYAPNAVIYYNGAVQDFTTLNAFVSEIRGAFPIFTIRSTTKWPRGTRSPPASRPWGRTWGC